MASKSLRDLFEDNLRDVYFAERQITRALPKMANAAVAPLLREAFEKHQLETETHIQRLEEVFDLLGTSPSEKTCPAILGIIEEGKEVMDEYADSPALDAGLIASAQAVEHYEISRYGTLRTWAYALGLPEVAAILQETLGEEKLTDETLTELSMTDANPKASQIGD